MSKTQDFIPNGPGGLPDPGFTLDQTSTVLWQAIDDPIGAPDEENTYAFWAGNLSYDRIGVTVSVPAFQGSPDDVIDEIKVVIRASGGLDANYNPVTPSGDGNTFYLGFRTGSPLVTYYKPVTLTSGNLLNYIRIWTYRTENIPFYGSDLVNFEIGIWYDTYVVNSGKSIAPNDNAANVMTQLYAQITYSPPKQKAGGAALLFL